MPTKPAPVLIFVPGGAWVHGSRAIQGYAVLSRLAAQGWVCLSIDYRVAPHHRWPRHILDVKTAIAWARANVDKFGGDRNFIAVAGCSAGGHLSALAGLTANDPQYQAELPEGSDTSVDAVVGIYGRYDWEDRSTPERARFVDFLERVVVQRTIDRHPEVFRDASPIQRVTRNAPPFLVIHGSRDCVIPVEQARSFVERLRAVSRSQVGYLELPGAGHGFDLLDGARTGPTAHAIALFLNQVHRSRAQFAKEVRSCGGVEGQGPLSNAARAAATAASTSAAAAIGTLPTYSPVAGQRTSITSEVDGLVHLPPMKSLSYSVALSDICAAPPHRCARHRRRRSWRHPTQAERETRTCSIIRV